MKSNFKVRVAAIQMTSTPDRSANLHQARRLFLEALSHQPYLVSFPESFSFLSGRGKELLNGAETLQDVTVETLQEWCAEYGVWIHAGGIFLKSKKRNKITNTSLLISPQGEIVSKYHKIHLFNAALSGDKAAYKESKTVKAGRKIVTAKLPFGVVGFSVCYDLRFPELFRKLADKGAHIIFIPAAFTALTGKAHWDVLTRARAIENQVFVIAAAQTGSPYPGRITYGHTRIIDPWGRVIAERPSTPGVVWADLDFEELNKVRSELPALVHRRI